MNGCRRTPAVSELHDAVRAWLKFDASVSPPHPDAPYDSHLAYETAKMDITERVAAAL